jgi:hypothetical protein
MHYFIWLYVQLSRLLFVFCVCFFKTSINIFANYNGSVNISQRSSLGAMISVLVSSEVDRGHGSGQTKDYKLVFAASHLSMYHYGIREMWSSRGTCLHVEC